MVLRGRVAADDMAGNSLASFAACRSPIAIGQELADRICRMGIPCIQASVLQSCSTMKYLLYAPSKLPLLAAASTDPTPLRAQ